MSPWGAAHGRLAGGPQAGGGGSWFAPRGSSWGGCPCHPRTCTGDRGHGGGRGHPLHPPPQPNFILTSGGGGPASRWGSPWGHLGEGSGCQGAARGDRGGAGPGVGLAAGGGAGNCAPPRLRLAWGERGVLGGGQGAPKVMVPPPRVIPTCCPPSGGLRPAPGTSPLPLGGTRPGGAHTARGEPPAPGGSLGSCWGMTAGRCLETEVGTGGHHSVSAPRSQGWRGRGHNAPV